MSSELNTEWIRIKFKDIAKEKSIRIDNPSDSEYKKYVGLEHLDSGEFLVKRYGSTKDVNSSMKLFKKGDILFARRNTYLRRVSVAPFDGVCSGDIIVINPLSKNIVPEFLTILMQFDVFENRIISLSAGAFSKRIKWKQLIEEELIIPSISEQKKISEILWTIEENIEKTEKLLETTEKLKKGLLNQLLIKGIGHTKFKETEIGEIPEEWEVFKFGEIINISKGVSYSSEDLSDIQGHILINLKCFNKGGGINPNGIKYYKGKYKETHIVCKNDLIIANTDITRDAEVIGYPALIPKFETDKDIIFTMDVSRIDIYNNLVLPKYLYYFLLTNNCHEYMVKNSSGTTVLHLNVNSIKTLEIPLPSIKEQEKIISILESFDDNSITYKSHITHLSNLKKKLTNEFLSGNVRIPPEVLENVQ